MHLITGKIGTDHITSANDGFRNAQIYGKGNLVFRDGGAFPATIIDNNTIRIGKGQGYIQGRFFEMTSEEDVHILNGTDAFNRCDLIVARYEKNENTMLESIRLVAITGERTSSGFVAPDYIHGNILEGDMIADFPLYAIEIEGVDIRRAVVQFEISDSIIKQLSDDVEDLADAVANKVDKVTGKGLSTNDYTTTEKSKLASLLEIKVGRFDGMTNDYGQAIFMNTANSKYLLGISPVQGFLFAYTPMVNSSNQLLVLVQDTSGATKTKTAVKFDYLYIDK